MRTYKLILVGGGVRAGKSAFAVNRARELGTRRVYIATAEEIDEEMRERVMAHREERGKDFETVEEPIALCETLEKLRHKDVVVVDCLTIWLSNLLLQEEPPERILERVKALLAIVASAQFHVLFVTNEVGMGVVPETRLGRIFRDLCGRVHQSFSRCADEVYFAALGTIIRIKPDPVCAVPPMG